MGLTTTLRAVLFMLGATTLATHAETVTVPVPLSYHAIETIARAQLFTGPHQQTELFQDRWNCNNLTLSDPHFSNAGNDHIAFQARLQAQLGTRVGDMCLPLFAWSGVFASSQQPVITADGHQLGFRIVTSRIRSLDNPTATVPTDLWDLIKTYVHPALEQSRIDLQPLLDATRSALYNSRPSQRERIDAVLDSVGFYRVTTDNAQLTVELTLEAPDAPVGMALLPTAALSAEEIALWDENLQQLDTLAAWLHATLAAADGTLDPQIAETIDQVVEHARRELRSALAEDNPQQDRIRQLFITTWNQLTPLLRHQLAQADTAMDPLQVLAFMGAGDALIAIDKVAQGVGLRFDATTWRGLARLLQPATEDFESGFDTDVDPELQQEYLP